MRELLRDAYRELEQVDRPHKRDAHDDKEDSVSINDTMVNQCGARCTEVGFHLATTLG